MENSNRPVQRVNPIRSESQNRVESNFNFQSSNNLIDTSCSESPQQYKIISGGYDLNFGNQNSIISSSQFIQQNVNTMNINLSNNGLLQGMSQDPVNSYSQTSATPKTYFQLPDGRYVQIAQNIQPVQHQIPTTILVQMPYKLLDQSGTNVNQSMMNKRFLLPSRIESKSPLNQRFVTLGNSINACNNLLIPNQQMNQSQMKQIELQNQSQTDYKRNRNQQQNEVNDQSGQCDGIVNQHVNINGSIIAIDKYQEICDILQSKKLLEKLESNDDSVLVEFRLNQQKYQLRMTRDQKVDMEKLLISAGNQQRQMEILQVYQSEQRKNTQQRTSVVLNQIINKNPPNIMCNTQQIQALNIAKPMYPLNSVLLAVPQNQFNDRTIIQSQTTIQQPKNASMPSTVSLQNPTNVTFNSRIATPQSSIMSAATITQESSKPNVKQKRQSKMPINCPQPMASVTCNQDMKPARTRRYNNMRKILSDDQNSVMQPNYRLSFEDVDDVVSQLLPYHILEESKEQRFDEVDRILADTMDNLYQRCDNLKRIASSMTINDVLADQESEHLLIKRMQLDLEMDVFERERCSAVIYDDVGAVDVGMVVVDDDDDGGDGGDGDHPVIVMDDHSPSMSPCGNDDDNLVDDSDALFAVCDQQSSLGNYDIQDISNDSSPDWAKDDHEEDPGTRHDEPDLDAAIQSILF